MIHLKIFPFMYTICFGKNVIKTFICSCIEFYLLFFFFFFFVVGGGVYFYIR